MRISRFIILSASLVMLLACSPSVHYYTDQLDTNKDKTFQLRMVKVAGGFLQYFKRGAEDNVRIKELALKNIPVADIINTLSEHYGLKIDAEINGLF